MCGETVGDIFAIKSYEMDFTLVRYYGYPRHDFMEN